MSFVAGCTNCGRRYALGEQMAGKRVKCKQCGTVFVAEASAGAPTPEPPAHAAGHAHPAAHHPSAAAPQNPFEDAADDPFAAMASLESAGAAPAPPTARGGGAMYAGASASYAPAAGGPPVAPFGLAQPVVIAAPRSKPIRRNTAVGLDAATPVLILAFLAGVVALAIIEVNKIPENTHPLAVPFVKSTIWATYITMAVCFFAVVAPLCWLGVFIGSKVMRFEMPAGAYARAAGVAAVPLVASLAIQFFIPENLALRVILVVGILPLAFYILKHSHELLMGEALVSYAFGAVFYVIGFLVTGAIVAAVLVSGAIGSKESVRRAIEEDDRKKSEEQVAARRGERVGPARSGPNFAPSRSGDGSPPPEAADPLEARATALRARLEQLDARDLASASRESVLASLRPVKADVTAARAQLKDRPEWADIERLVASVEQKAGGLPSDAPDPGIFQPMPAGTEFPPPAAGEVALGEEVTFGGKYNVRPPAEAKLDLRNSGDAQLAWKHDKAFFGAFKLSHVPRKNPKQLRPWLVTKPFMKNAAERDNLFYVDATAGGDGAAGGGGPTIAYGKLNGIPIARALSAADGAAGGGGERWAQYVALDGNDWVVFDIRGKGDEATAFDVFEMAARTLRPLKAGEAKVDPFAPERVAERLGEEPEAAAAILRKNPAAAEPIVVRLLASPDVRTRRAAAGLLQFVGTEKTVPLVQQYATTGDADVQAAVRAFLKRLRPDQFDAVAEALLDLKGDDSFKRRAAMERLAALPVDPKRRNEVSALVEPSLMDWQKAFHEGEAAAKVLAVWAGDRTATRLAAALNNKDLERGVGSGQRDHLITALSGTKDKLAAAVIAKWAGVSPDKVTEALIRLGPVAEDDTIKVLNMSMVDKTPVGAKARAALVAALAEIGTSKSLPALTTVSKDKRDLVVQETARQAIESVKARAAAPKPAPAAAPRPGTTAPAATTRPTTRATVPAPVRSAAAR